MSIKCSYCTSALCIGCQRSYEEKYSGKFFKGYSRNYVFRTQVGCDIKPIKFGG